MADKTHIEWKRHSGGDPRPIQQGGQRIQWRVIGSHRTKVVRAGKHDWSMTFEWRYLG